MMDHSVIWRWPVRGRVPLLALLAAGCVVAAGCETLADPDGLPYVERLVIDGVAVADTTVHNIRISRTLPINAAYSREATYVADAIGTITTPDGSFPLVYTGEGLYDAPGAIPRPGQPCRIDVQWHGKRASASIRMPLKPEVSSIDSRVVDSYGGDSTNQVRGFFAATVARTYPDAVYRLTIEYSRDGERYRSNGGGYSTWWLRAPRDTTPNGTLTVLDYSTELPLRDSLRWRAVVSAYNRELYVLAATINERHDDGPFSSTRSAEWNVTGDGIGLFVGRSSTVIQGE